MKLALSTVREKTPFATPPRVLVVADEGYTTEAINLADALDEIGAEAEVRFGENANVQDSSITASQPDAVIVAGMRGYRVARHHPILNHVRSLFAPRGR